MEVAGQWRREWAGTAEYGKVTEGGVTRRIARAMEVLNASAPGARVRVMRAAYHSTAGPGTPASSYMLHSSRRVISSGFNYLEPPSYPAKPLEISSSPLESSPDRIEETENYKVTEPDDTEISEPSKWRATTSKFSVRMPSEESSSTDNASIIDLDPHRNNKNTLRKYSCDSESSDIESFRRTNSRFSLLESPTTLSTLKYKSLLNSSSDWNNRRKSYSFEDTSPLHETISHNNDTLAMESSTDSGICKSSELVNDHSEDNNHLRLFDRRSSPVKSHVKPISKNRERDYFIERPIIDHNISLQSPGKVTITLPFTVADDFYDYNKNHTQDDSDRRVKKVEFCKTELHFTAETGKVNIIATDDKPPPSNDFRKRRSAFVPINEKFEKPITLFGEKNIREIEEDINYNTSDVGESDENTAATKSILKNKIPKPKPYLLGENMVFGSSDIEKNNNLGNESHVRTAVSLINKQLQKDTMYGNNKNTFSCERNSNIVKTNSFRTVHKGPSINDDLKLETNFRTKEKYSSLSSNDSINADTNSVKKKIMQMSPIPGRAKTRQLRDGDLMYFGIDEIQKSNSVHRDKQSRNRLPSPDNTLDSLFHSVKLIQQISNSVCSSETESEDAPEYQNIPIKTNFVPVATPRSRTKYNEKSKNIDELRVLKPIIEQDSDVINVNNILESRRPRVRTSEGKNEVKNRSISEPPKKNRQIIEDMKNYEGNGHIRSDLSRKDSMSPRFNRNRLRDQQVVETSTTKKVVGKNTSPRIKGAQVNEKRSPEYMNIETKNKGANKTEKHSNSLTKHSQTTSSRKPRRIQSPIEKCTLKSFENSRHNCDKNDPKDSIDRRQRSHKKERVQRTEKLCTPEYTRDHSPVTIEPKRNSRQKDSNEENSLNKNLQNHDEKGYTVKKAFDHTVNNKNGLEFTESLLKINDNIKNNPNTTSTKFSARKDSPKTQNTTLNSIDSNKKATVPKSYVINGMDKYTKPNEKLDKTKHSKRSEYVINYDDKNGTVSSICKIKSGLSTKRKKVSRESIDTPKESKVKTPSKTFLLQFPDQERNPKGQSYANKKWKTKTNVQHSCQVL